MDVAKTGPDNRRAPGPQEYGDQPDSEYIRLLLAARTVLERSGWWGFKVASVLREAHLSTRSFYRNFGTKSGLLAALLDYELSAAAARLRKAVVGQATPIEGLRAYLEAMIDMAYTDDLVRPASLFAAQWRELLREYPEVMDRCIGMMVDPLREVLETGKANGDFRSVNPRSDAIAIFNLAASMTADQASVGGRTPREHMTSVILPFIERAINADA